MNFLTPALFLPMSLGAVLCVFSLGILAWRRNPSGRGGVLFALISLCVGIWTLAGFMGGDIVWQTLFFMSVAFAPALAIHAAADVSGRPFRAGGWLSYFFALSLVVLRVTSTTNVVPLIALLFYVAGVLMVASELYPALHAFSDRASRRRATYGLLLLTLFLMAGMGQFTIAPIQGMFLLFAFVFFLLASVAFERTRLFGVDIAAIEALFILFLAVTMTTVVILRGSLLAIPIFCAAVIIGLFGAFALSAVRREERERLMRSESFAMATHQWLGTLSGIRAASDLFARGDAGMLNPTGIQVADELRRSAERLVAMMETALHQVHLDLGAFEPMPNSTNVALEIQSIISSLDPLARSKNVELSGAFADVPEQATIDLTVLRNVVFNLIENAIKYTDEGCVRVMATSSGSRLRVTVTDTGCGIHHESLRHLFKKFHRGRMMAGKTRGSGLGLHVAKRLVDSVGGELRVQSGGLGKGSTFTVEIPMIVDMA